LLAIRTDVWDEPAAAPLLGDVPGELASAGVVAEAADGDAGRSGALDATWVAETGTTPLDGDRAASPFTDIDGPEAVEAEDVSEDNPAKYEHPAKGRIAIAATKNPALSARSKFFPDMTPRMILTPRNLSA
jgi:hypothetical protein